MKWNTASWSIFPRFKSEQTFKARDVGIKLYTAWKDRMQWYYEILLFWKILINLRKTIIGIRINHLLAQRVHVINKLLCKFFIRLMLSIWTEAIKVLLSPIRATAWLLKPDESGDHQFTTHINLYGALRVESARETAVFTTSTSQGKASVEFDWVHFLTSSIKSWGIKGTKTSDGSDSASASSAILSSSINLANSSLELLEFSAQIIFIFAFRKLLLSRL